MTGQAVTLQRKSTCIKPQGEQKKRLEKKGIPRARHQAKCYMYCHSCRYNKHLDFTDEETEAQRAGAASPRREG